MPENQDVKHALLWGRGELRSAGSEAPGLTAELLLAHVLGWDRIKILSHPEHPVRTGEGERFAALVRRRAAGEPLQYLTGMQEFLGLPFLVTPAVLIPRPETEILVEKALHLSKRFEAGRICFIDVGTGSGCIAVSFAYGQPRTVGWAVDVSGDALAVARANATRHNVADRLGFLRGDLLDSFPQRPSFEFILSNPPYVARRDAAVLPVMVRDHEPDVALFSGDSGMDVYLRLIPQAAQRLVNGGYLLLEVGAGMSEEVIRLVEREGLSMESVESDLQGIPRCIVARRSHG